MNRFEPKWYYLTSMSRAKRAFVALRAIIVAALFVSLWFWLASSVRRYDPLLGIAPPQFLRPVGWVLAVAGAGLAASCIAVFATRGQGTPAPFDPPQVFVASGPYRYVRNPMYVGATCALLGGALIVRSVSILLLALLFWAIAHAFVLTYEEPALEQRFGESYRQYRKNVRRWLPKR
jgi:protein-S-isoprenylcysteine O-methyltransferase Ste14